tara:strand:- start:139 stop:603 length:465 start_codon:yes stop_codon:yes gene_type:complete
MSKNYIWASIDEIPFNLDPGTGFLEDYGIKDLGQFEVDPKLLPYIDNSFYADLVEKGTEPFEFEYITFFNSRTHNLIKYDGKELKTYCVENYDLIGDEDEDDEDAADNDRDSLWEETLEYECLPEAFYNFLKKNNDAGSILQNKNVDKMFHQSV